jgi:hypothetical protein
MMDAKKALEANDGDMEASKQWLREKGLAASAKRDDRESNQGVVALLIEGNVGAIVKLKSETDFVAASDQFKAEADALAEARRRQGAGGGQRAAPAARRPQDHAQGADRARRRRPMEARPATSSTATSTSRAGAASTPCSSRWKVATRRSRTTSRCTSRSPGRSGCSRDEVPTDVVEKERQTLE